MNILYSFQLAVSFLLLTGVVLPFVKNDYWIFRILEYPRYQKLILCALVLASLLLTGVYATTYGIIALAAMTLCVIYLLYKIAPYTPWYKKEMKSVVSKDEANQIKLYTANIYQDSRCYDKVLQQIEEYQPDVVLLLETDELWEKEMDVLNEAYPYSLKAPLPNTYGLLFYSKLQMEGKVNYLVEDDVPSVEAVVQLRSGQGVKVWGLHPKPPVPTEDRRSTAKDKELMKVAFKAKDEKLPVIVMGDLNDVAWSYVTELFRKTSGLLDPRRGRGFYSTFSTHHRFVRFPLDYVFCSSRFGLVRMERLPQNGSDHFPMLSHFEYMPHLENVQEKPHADKEEKEDAKEKLEQPTRH